MALHQKRQEADDTLQKLLDANYIDNIMLLGNTPTQAESLLYRYWTLCEYKQNRVHVFQSKRKHLHTKWGFFKISR